MRRTALTFRDRAGAWGAVALVHAAIALLVLSAGDAGTLSAPEAVAIDTFDVLEQRAPPLRAEQRPARLRPREEGAASPPNLESQATPAVAPPPRIELPTLAELIASETPAEGAQPTQGAAPTPGPGTGAGGAGTGTGSGGAGSGPGGGGRAGEGTRPSVVAGTTLTGRDYGRDVLRAWPSRARIFVAIRVQLDGRGTDCRVDRSSGNPVVDQWTCRLVEQRVRFRPATDEDGRPYVSWYGYVQTPVNF